MRFKPSSKTARPIAVDLFAGAGGLSLGFEQAGFDISAVVEIDPIHCATHEFNFPNSKVICASVADVSGEEIRVRAGIGARDIDVVCGGAPCQGFSLMGRRALDDPRNQLVFHYVRLVKELRPKYFVFENVKGLTLGPHKKFLNELIEELESAGYWVDKSYRVLNAAEFGVPQDRHRLFLIGNRPDVTRVNYPVPTGSVTVAEAINDLPNADKYKTLLNSESVRSIFSTESGYARRLRCMQPDSTDFSHPRIFDRDLLTSSLRTSHSEKSRLRFLKTLPGATEPISRFRRLDPEGLCNTLRAGTDSARGAFTSARPIHPKFARVITVREAARLHSYPDWFRFHFTKWHGFRQIGNSVPPLLARAVAGQVVRSLGRTPQKPTIPMQLGDMSLLQFDMGEAASYFSVSRGVIAQRTRKVALIESEPMPRMEPSSNLWSSAEGESKKAA